MQNCNSFTFTFLANASILGLFGAFSAIKNPLSKDLRVTQTFLGTLDALTFVGRILGAIYLLFYPAKRPKLSYTIQSFIHTILVCLLFQMVKWSPDQHKVWLILAMLISGFGKAFVIFSRILFLNFNDPFRDAYKINLWQSILSLGDVFGILFTNWLIRIGIQWNYAFMIYMAIFLLIGILQHLFVGEVENHRQMQETICEYISNTWQILKEFLKIPRNILWLITSLFVTNFYFLILMWFPYYFTQVGFSKDNSSIISIIYPLTIVFGSIILNYLLTLCESKSEFFVISFFLICVGIFIAFIGIQNSQQNMPIFIILLGLVGFLYSPGLTRTNSTQLARYTEGDTNLRIKFFVFNNLINFYKLLQCFQQVFQCSKIQNIYFIRQQLTCQQLYSFKQSENI